LNINLKDKNEKILELLSELEEVKIQVYARDKTIELQARQINDLLRDIKEARMLENDMGITTQEKQVIEDENKRLRKELDRNAE